jgi:long-chain acyl-CoA synthetase
LLIGQCFVHGDSFQNCLVAIVVPDEDPVRHWAKTNNEPETTSFADLCNNSKSPQLLKAAIMTDIQNLSRAGGLLGFETVKDIYLENELFSAEKDLVTPTFKLKRNKLRDAYQGEIDAMYANMAAVPVKSKL